MTRHPPVHTAARGPELAARVASLRTRFDAVRARTRALAAPIGAEDAMVQSMDDASPAKWHLAHTTWFFERFALMAGSGCRAVDPQWDFLFNSYYESVGPMHARPRRGLLSRPTLAQVLDYRDVVDDRMRAWLDGPTPPADLLDIVELGLQHEQQHQELLLTDIKHAFWSNPLAPAYRADLPETPAIPETGTSGAGMRWIERDEAIVRIGAAPWPQAAAFAYDNESPRHRALVTAHALASRPVSNREYRDFVDDGGYRTAALWLSAGWDTVQRRQWTHPLYWDDDHAREFTLGGWRTLQPDAPVCHLSHFEADAFARWAGARLPTEMEWEQAATGLAVAGNFADDGRLHPHAGDGAGLRQMFGDVWEWTSSAYTAYPGFRPWPGSLGEYNGKFMCGQWVLRGGSCATPRTHMRASYRNFFPSDARWQFAGLRLARDPA
ncbi:ergothioneine biosynthesis protein EgtB [Luteimonas sp. BDR2-5]|uniref:ergothioneine biosynthesis protein EgtB n=1 Tax=Proluteimonas luteida TaxID=2878685 RepID=UPI001E4BB64B|nr:ergothioneine biosynthesis protein EgtB [Luteimonas sp. BDR2-5]MCD9027780.1 ergothioneine biosynthesis protein EgtB [Luteimonas sp. BDR2-5]